MKTDPRTLRRAKERILAVRKAALTPRPRLTLSEWADKYAKLSVETSAEPGEWKTFGPQRGVMDAMTDVRRRRVVVRKGVRIGFTKALVWLCGYHMHWDPASVLFFQPTDSDSKDFGESEIVPMIRDVPEILKLSNVALEGKAKEQWHTRKFKNGAIFRLRGAAAEGNFRRLTTRINIGDEIDDDNWDDKSGDKLSRLKERGRTYWNSKLILGGSPVLPAEHGGRTDAEFQDSDQQYFYVTCPHCGHIQQVVFGDKEGPGIKWNEDLTEAWYQCAGEKACRIEEEHQIPMLQHGDWIAHNPTHEDAGFHYPQLNSQFVTWLEIAKQWRRALDGGMSKIKVFKNEVLGEPFYEDTGTKLDEQDLLENVVEYGAEVPDWVEGLFAGVDVQKGNEDGSASYMEAGIWGFGPNGRICLIGHWILDEFPLTDPRGRAFDKLEELMLQSFTASDGRPRYIESMSIDSHGGFSQKVYSWIETMRKKGGRRRRWFAVRGANNAPGTRKETIWPKSASKKNPVLYTIDVNLAKDELAVALEGGLVEFPNQTLPGAEDINVDFMKRLTREKQVPVPGKPAPKWTSPSDQEPWDCLVYAYASTHGIRSLPGGQKWKRLLGKEVVFRPRPVSEPIQEEEVETAEIPAASPPSPPKNAFQAAQAQQNSQATPGFDPSKLVRVGPGFRPPR